jgi:hypothetical protein
MPFRSILLILGIVCLIAACGVGLLALHEIWRDWAMRPENGQPAMNAAATPLAVLGDSNSQGYHDGVNLPDRFGRYQGVTFQWTEVLSKLRGNELDLGVWGVRGTRRSLAVVMDRLGLRGRHPRQEDFLHSLAIGGAGCDSLMGYSGRQAPRLVAEMNRRPEPWRHGVVVIRIGVNDLLSLERSTALARDRGDPLTRARIGECLNQISASVALIHAAHAETRIVLVGLSMGEDPTDFDLWRAPGEYQNLVAGLKPFDDGLRALAAADRRIAFFDDKQWFEDHWGARDKPPGYKTVFLGPQRWPVTLTQGDHPANAWTQDLHAGVVWNALWAQSLVALMNSAFGMALTPITDDEVLHFLEPALKLPRQ